MATWTKLKSGKWGIKLQRAAREGESVQVKRKDGSVSTVVITKVVWTDGSSVSLCAIDEGEKSEDYFKRQPHGPARETRRRRYVPCGYPGCSPSYCDECDGEGRLALAERILAS